MLNIVCGGVCVCVFVCTNAILPSKLKEETNGMGAPNLPQMV